MVWPKSPVATVLHNTMISVRRGILVFIGCTVSVPRAHLRPIPVVEANVSSNRMGSVVFCFIRCFSLALCECRSTGAKNSPNPVATCDAVRPAGHQGLHTAVLLDWVKERLLRRLHHGCNYASTTSMRYSPSGLPYDICRIFGCLTPPSAAGVLGALMDDFGGFAGGQLANWSATVGWNRC